MKYRKFKHRSLTKLIIYAASGLILVVGLGVIGINSLTSNSDDLVSTNSSVNSSTVAVVASPDNPPTVDSSDIVDPSSIPASSKSQQSTSVTSSSEALTTEEEESSISASSQTSVSNSTHTPTANIGDEYRAVWISYLELEGINMSSEQSFNSAMTAMLDNCVATGINTVIFHVRPFGDALYNSSIFPTSHLISGTQGASLPYDPLSVVIDLCRARGLRIEAWINPYRVQLTSNKPSSLSSTNPAVSYMNNPSTADYVVSANDGLYYNPAYTEVQDLIVSGVVELVNNYDIDGIQFDDYFYPTTDASFDSSAYAKLGSGNDLAVWRRENVNSLVTKVYSAVKNTDPSVVFGISPQGNNSNNYNSQYSDVNLWLSTPGYVDYIMPQLYWGFDYLTASGRTDYQFVTLSNEWASYPRAASVSLYIGLGAYRVGVGDGGANDQAEWSSGNNLAKQVEALRQISGISGFALYRYDSLFNNSNSLATQEVSNLRSILG